MDGVYLLLIVCRAYGLVTSPGRRSLSEGIYAVLGMVLGPTFFFGTLGEGAHP